MTSDVASPQSASGMSGPRTPVTRKTMVHRHVKRDAMAMLVDGVDDFEAMRDVISEASKHEIRDPLVDELKLRVDQLERECALSAIIDELVTFKDSISCRCVLDELNELNYLKDGVKHQGLISAWNQAEELASSCEDQDEFLFSRNAIVQRIRQLLPPRPTSGSRHGLRLPVGRAPTTPTTTSYASDPRTDGTSASPNTRTSRGDNSVLTRRSYNTDLSKFVLQGCSIEDDFEIDDSPWPSMVDQLTPTETFMFNSQTNASLARNRAVTQDFPQQHPRDRSATDPDANLFPAAAKTVLRFSVMTPSTRKDMKKINGAPSSSTGSRDSGSVVDETICDIDVDISEDRGRLHLRTFLHKLTTRHHPVVAWVGKTGRFEVDVDSPPKDDVKCPLLQFL